MTAPLTGTVAIVTGASSGIGDATTRRLAEHGASVAVVARRKDRLDSLVKDIEAAGGTALAVDTELVSHNNDTVKTSSPPPTTSRSRCSPGTSPTTSRSW